MALYGPDQSRLRDIQDNMTRKANDLMAAVNELAVAMAACESDMNQLQAWKTGGVSDLDGEIAAYQQAVCNATNPHKISALVVSVRAFCGDTHNDHLQYMDLRNAQTNAQISPVEPS